MNFASWLSAISGSFNDKTKWSGGVVPNSTYGSVTIAASGGPYTVTSSVSNTIGGLVVGSSATLSLTAGAFWIQQYYANAGTIKVGPGAQLQLGTAGQWSGFANSGTIDLNGGATAAKMVIAGKGVNFTTGGTIALSNSANNQITGGTSIAEATFELTNGTLKGAGAIGGAFMQFVNGANGTVNASQATTLKIVGAIGKGIWDENDGLIEATGTGGLVIDADMFNGGTIQAAAIPGSIPLTGSAITFGTGSLTASPTISGAGIVEATASGAKINLDDATLGFLSEVSTVAGSALTSLAGTTNWLGASLIDNAGSIVVADGSTLNLNASVEDVGKVSIGGASSKTSLLIYGAGVRLQGGGTVVMSDFANNLIGSSASAASSGTTLDNEDFAIKGSGTIGDANLRFVNLGAGTVNSNGAKGLTLVGDANANLKPAYNSGLIENTGSGGLKMKNAWDNAGTIEEAGASALNLLNFSVAAGGGYIKDDAGGTINLTNASITASHLIVAASATVNLTNNETSTIGGGLINHGAIDVNGAALIVAHNLDNYGALNLAGSGTATATADVLELSGGYVQLLHGGRLVLGDSAGNKVVSDGSSEFFNNVDNTISGFGTIGDAHVNLQNSLHGTIDANSTNPLTINTGSNWITNAGLIELTNTGGLTIAGNINNQGTFSASAGLLDVKGNVGSFGQSNISGSGSIEFGGSVYQDVTFKSGATGRLILDHSASNSPGEIYGFGGSAKIDLKDIVDTSLIKPTHAYTSALNEGTLTVTDGTHTAHLYLIGNYTNSSFSLSSDLHGGTLVSFV